MQEVPQVRYIGRLEDSVSATRRNRRMILCCCGWNIYVYPILVLWSPRILDNNSQDENLQSFHGDMINLSIVITSMTLSKWHVNNLSRMKPGNDNSRLGTCYNTGRSLCQDPLVIVAVAKIISWLRLIWICYHQLFRAMIQNPVVATPFA